MEAKRCVTCNRLKWEDEFYVRKNRRDPYDSICIVCRKLRGNVWKKKNPEKYRSLKANYRQYNRNKLRAYENNYHYKKSYNISREDKDRMLIEQGYSCYICKRSASLFKNGLHVDHNHDTGQVRKLLCPFCNTLVGYLETKSDLLSDINQYIKIMDSMKSTYNTILIKERGGDC